MGTKNDYLPTKCWIENGQIHRAFFEYEEWLNESPRDCCNLSVIVNASKYGLDGDGDIKIDSGTGEEWLINATGIDENWYYANKERYGGLDALAEKFEREKCVAFEWLSVYDHSGITVSCGRASGWDYSWVGFAYVSKDNEEVKAYRKSHTLKETKEWASHILHSEIHTLDQYCRGDVYCCVEEVYDKDTDSWEQEDCIGYIYLNDETCQTEKEDAISCIRDNFAGKKELFDSDVVDKAIELDAVENLLGQSSFDFMKEILGEVAV